MTAYTHRRRKLRGAGGAWAEVGRGSRPVTDAAHVGRGMSVPPQLQASLSEGHLGLVRLESAMLSRTHLGLVRARGLGPGGIPVLYGRRGVKDRTGVNLPMGGDSSSRRYLHALRNPRGFGIRRAWPRLC